MRPVDFRFSFRRLIQAFLVVDAALIVLLTAGFVVRSSPSHDRETGALPAGFYDDTAKLSPLTAPAPEPVRPKAEISIITARGDRPTFVPAPEPDGALAGGGSEAAAGEDHDPQVIPAGEGVSAPDSAGAQQESAPAAHTS